MQRRAFNAGQEQALNKFELDKRKSCIPSTSQSIRQDFDYSVNRAIRPYAHNSIISRGCTLSLVI